MKKPMRMVFSLYGGKIKGIAATIIQSVLDKTIDIHYVFTKSFYNDYANAWGMANNRNNEDLDEVLLPEWFASLDYINEVRDCDDADRDFGVYKTKYFVHTGDRIARDVICNIINGFYTDEIPYLKIPTAYQSIPHILNDPKWLSGRSNHFIVLSNGTGKSVELDIHTFIALPQNKDVYIAGAVNTDIYHITENVKDEEYKFDQYAVMGFLAALINAIFSDMICRDVYSLNFFNKDEIVEFVDDEGFLQTIIDKDIPKNLYTPAKKIIDIYYPQALINLSKRLKLLDIAYVDSKKYVIEKMLALEIEQREKIKSSQLWDMLDNEQQNMLMAYHQCFIDFLKSRPEITTASRHKSSKSSKSTITGGNFNNCTFNQYFNTPSISPESHSGSSSPAPDVRTESSVPKKRGPKAKPLFANEDGSENTTRTKIEKERLRAYINDHKLGSRQLTTEQDNILLKTAVCFYCKWLQAGYVTTANNATPLVRFLTETCEIPNKSDKVSIANRLLEMLKSGDYDREIAGQVSEYF